MKRDACSWCNGKIHKIEIPAPRKEGEKATMLRLEPLFIDNMLTYRICEACLRRELYLASTKPQKPLDPERPYHGPA